jgi:hypothetical protein
MGNSRSCIVMNRDFSFLTLLIYQNDRVYKQQKEEFDMHRDSFRVTWPDGNKELIYHWEMSGNVLVLYTFAKDGINNGPIRFFPVTQGGIEINLCEQE